MKGLRQIGLASMVLLCIASTGCMTMKRKSVLSPEVRLRIRTVTVHTQIDTPHKIDTPDIGNGVVGAVASSKRESGFNRKVLEHTDFQKLVAETVRSEFKKRVAGGNVFTLVDDGKPADGEFLLEVRYLGMTKPHFAVTSELTPAMRLDVTLIENAPVKMIRARSGRLVPANQDQNPIVYHRSYKVRNTPDIPSYTQIEFETDKEKFHSAMKAAVEDVVRSIVAEW